jgi:hypothetical protein
MRILHMIFVFAFAQALNAGCHEALPREAPELLVGVWKTTNPRYAERYFEIRNTELIIGTSKGEAEVHALRGVESKVADDRLSYALHYGEADGGESILAFYFDGNIRLVNQEDILWTRAKKRDETPTAH